MKNQKGYLGNDWSGFFFGLIVIAIISGIAVWEFLKWLWPFVKSFIHAATT